MPATLTVALESDVTTALSWFVNGVPATVAAVAPIVATPAAMLVPALRPFVVELLKLVEVDPLNDVELLKLVDVELLNDVELLKLVEVELLNDVESLKLVEVELLNDVESDKLVEVELLNDVDPLNEIEFDKLVEPDNDVDVLKD